MKKALKIIGISLLALLGIALVVLYIIFPTDTKNALSYFWQMLNTPLPIVGITTVALLVFIWNVVVFIRKNQPRKELSVLRKEHEDYKNDSEKEKEKLKKQNDNLLRKNKELKGFIIHICELSPNKKIKDYGKELLGYGEETTDSNTEEE